MANPAYNADGTRLESVMSSIRGRIANRSLTPGSKLPSIRGCARAMGVSKSTVVEAYDRLAAEGVIRSRPGAGFFVTAPLAPLSLAEIGPALDREVDPLWISRQALASSARMSMPGCGWLPASWMPDGAMRRALRRLSRAAPETLADYGPPLGSQSLRARLARRMAAHGIEVAPAQVMLTDSGTQAIDLLCRFLLKPGDTVLVDDPCYFNFHALLRAHQVKIVGVPYTPGGPDIERFSEALTQHGPRLYITNSALQNPTGAVLSPSVAHRILMLAEQFDLTIVEDDIFADFEVEPAPRLAAFDGLSRVVYIGSFSKSLSASVRCGFVAAPPDWIEGLTDLRIATCFGGPALAAELIVELLGDGSYRKHMEAVRQRLSRSREAVGARLEKLGIVPWIEPKAGMFLWCRLPEGRDAAALARRALERGVVLAPGNAFSLSGSARSFLRFNVAQSEDEHIFSVLAELMRAN
ncbi:PLP-dependent aminotransferase family protein [uncultured Nitratireductor sp.]|uniref:aminotransferase-like domain-containing protein n=1 Tax=uncultured Nitratireductor sp. TaxID=520953 RepID=UPI0025F9B06B|nr:PLP-dependent aminotransferase family protein [uncultured Nitratireductor sp.]